MRSACLPRHPAVAYLFLVRSHAHCSPSDKSVFTCRASGCLSACPLHSAIHPTLPTGYAKDAGLPQYSSGVDRTSQRREIGAVRHFRFLRISRYRPNQSLERTANPSICVSFFCGVRPSLFMAVAQLRLVRCMKQNSQRGQLFLALAMLVVGVVGLL